MSKFSDLYGKHNSDKTARSAADDAFAAAKSALDSAVAAETASNHDLAVAVYGAPGHQSYEMLPNGGIKVYTSTSPTAFDESFPAGPDSDVPAPAAPAVPTPPAVSDTPPAAVPTPAVDPTTATPSPQ